MKTTGKSTYTVEMSGMTENDLRILRAILDSVGVGRVISNEEMRQWARDRYVALPVAD